MTTIKLKNGFYIEIDNLNYTLRQRYTGVAKDGTTKDAVRTCGYFGNIRLAVEKYIKITQLDVLDSETLTLMEYVKSIEQINIIAVQGLESVLERFAVK